MKRISNDTRDFAVSCAVPVALVIVMLVILAVIDMGCFLAVVGILFTFITVAVASVSLAKLVKMLTLKIIDYINERSTGE